MSQRSSYARPVQHTLGLTSPGDAPPRPVEPDLKTGGIPLAAYSPGSTDFSDLLPSNANDAIVRIPRQQQYPLLHWATSHGPWDPVHGRASDVFRATSSFCPQPSAASFSGYRSYTSPSECETTGPGHLPSDSGYGSAHRQDVVDGSLYGDGNRSTDAESVSSHFAGVHFDRPVVAPPEPWSQHSSIHNETPVTAQTDKLVCQHCNAKVKTKSELKKHDQKHTKPHRCKVTDCSRSEGFSTPNDVDRHMRSCHPEFGTKGKYYKCTEAYCRSKDKKWPRADNFRQHLKRVHYIQPPDDDIERYVCGPQLSPGPDLAGLTSVGHGLIPLDGNHNDMHQDSWHFNLQPVQHEGARAPCGINDYLHHNMVFQQDVIPQQHLGVMSRAADHVPNSLMQMSAVEGDTGAPLTQSSEGYVPSQGLENVRSSDAQQTRFEEASYFNEAIPDDGLEEDNQSVIYHGSEALSTFTEDMCDESSIFEQPANRSCGAATVAADELNALPSHNVVTLDYDDSSSTRSSSATSSYAADDDLMQLSPDAGMSSSYPIPAAALDVSEVIKDQAKAYDLIKALKEQGLLAGLLEQVEYQGFRDEEMMPNAITPPGRDASKSLHVCSESNDDKSFPRQCELRQVPQPRVPLPATDPRLGKYMERHAKLHGCTFPTCDKSFGSENDWKGHENSQHFQLELWKCNEKSKLGASAPCSKAFNRREHFKSHLARDHSITECGDVERKLEDCLDESNCEITFWCGFCEKTVQITEKGLKAWLGRFNHINAHFSGQLDNSEWKSPDPNSPNADIVLMAPSETCHSGLQDTKSALSAGADIGGRPSKRGADGGVQYPRPPKKARPSAWWFCCRCRMGHIAGFTTACLQPSCGGHEQCRDCELEAVPLNSNEHYRDM